MEVFSTTYIILVVKQKEKEWDSNMRSQYPSID